ncbi:lipopolysaccharide biosynthesis protein [Thalassotalea crassostreae]|uniref:lipopolysaccharide biosynthesis protein n=1 Tax=Thalassotalea crassostreae TaxID=1763536 RepID=UPI0008394BAF|nr:lipopolysaccharide biosynthesis protein [Thalassotalea crassostreae]
MTIKNKVIYSLKWVVIGKVFIQLIRWGVTFWTVRMLTPEDYGLVGLSDFFLSFLWMFAVSGSGAAIIQSQTNSKESLRGFFTAILIMNSIFCLLLLASSGFIASIYQKPEIESIINISAFAFLIVTFQIIPSALISQSMDFKKSTFVEVGSQFLSSISILYMAYSGFGFWSLVYGELILLTISAIAFNIISPIKVMPGLSFKEAKKLVVFGSKVSISSIISHFNHKVDIAIAGLILTATELGQYQIALIIAAIPLQKIIPSLKRVAFPAFAKIQDDKKSAIYYLLKSQKIGAYIVFPIFLGISISAELFVPVILGENWLQSIVPIMIVSLVMPFRFCREMFSPLINGLGNPGLLLNCSIISLIVTVFGVYVGMQFGVIGISYAILFIGILIFFISTTLYCRYIELPYQIYLFTFRRPLIHSAIMLLTVSITKQVSSQYSDSYTQLFFCLFAGLLSYLTTIFIFDKNIIIEIKTLLKK